MPRVIVGIKIMLHINFILSLKIKCQPNVFNPKLLKVLVNMDAIANMVAWSRGRIKLELKPKADNEFDSVVSIDRASDFSKWLHS